jgi:hypothetical protein
VVVVDVVVVGASAQSSASAAPSPAVICRTVEHKYAVGVCVCGGGGDMSDRACATVQKLQGWPSKTNHPVQTEWPSLALTTTQPSQAANQGYEAVCEMKCAWQPINMLTLARTPACSASRLASARFVAAGS